VIGRMGRRRARAGLWPELEGEADRQGSGRKEGQRTPSGKSQVGHGRDFKLGWISARGPSSLFLFFSFFCFLFLFNF
jgi:hypothetical protein